MAISDLGERIGFLNRGQGWVVRKLRELLPRVRDNSLHADLSEMLRSHEANIALATEVSRSAYSTAPGSISAFLRPKEASDNLASGTNGSNLLSSSGESVSRPHPLSKVQPRLSARVCAAGLVPGSAETLRVFR